MAEDHDAEPGGLPTSRFISLTPERPFETGESSANASLHYTTASSRQNQRGPSDGSGASDPSPNAREPKRSSEDTGRDGRSRRKTKSRSGGGFLLQTATHGDKEQGSRRRSRAMHLKGKSVARTLERPQAETSVLSSPGRSSEEAPRVESPARRSRENPDAIPAIDLLSDPDRSNRPLSSHDPLGPDVDSTEIVNMALNLSESRRITSRQYAQRTTPPRLAPLPESVSKSNLRQHLQQQRKASRTGSPKPSQAISTRPQNFQRFNNHFQQGLDDGQEVSFNFNFSASTLARARKAKEHLELMAEYRRLLRFLPPLKDTRGQNMTSPPGSPYLSPALTRTGSDGVMPAFGRPYNPLQYVRNRKVRARERKVVDGEQQGFGDVHRVRAWVDQISQSHIPMALKTDSEPFALPLFNGAEEEIEPSSGEAITKSVSRTKRPRVDWFFDPCDILADAYWLEQDHHKHLIEDRQWRKIFPSTTEPHRPAINQQPSDIASGISPIPTKQMDGTDVYDSQDHYPPQKAANRPSLGTIDRAKSKINERRGFHRHSHSYVHHDFLRRRHSYSSTSSGSLSDSDSDEEKKGEKWRKKRLPRRETLTTDTNELLEKQMADMVAQETRDNELSALSEAENLPRAHTDPALGQKPSSKPPTTSHSRRESTDISDTDLRERQSKPAWGVTGNQQRGRASLEVPRQSRKGSVVGGMFSSSPNSPQLSPSKDHGGIMTPLDIEMSLSRAQSPTRNPLSKVKRKILEKSRDHLESQSEAEEESDQLTALPEVPLSPERTNSKLTDEAARLQRISTGMRSDGVGLRSIFKPPRIDTVIRGGVSKLGDMIWKKDSSSDSSDDSSDESDAEEAKLRSKTTLSRSESVKSSTEVPHSGKHFYDELPVFHHVSETSIPPNNRDEKMFSPDSSKLQSPGSSHWDLIKPPKIDVQNASPAPTTPGQNPSVSEESDSSVSRIDHANAPDGAQPEDDRLLSATSLDALGRRAGRHWSIADISAPPEHAQLSKREVARMRVLIVTSGIKAMEITRRANGLHKPLSNGGLDMVKTDPISNVEEVPWPSIAALSPPSTELQEQEVLACELYPLASRALGMATQASGQRWQASADCFTSRTVPLLQQRLLQVRSRLTDDLSQLTRQIADEADETSKSLALDQPLKVKHVVDVMDKLLRKRRRRFRWVRRGLWLAVEWGLVGFMWYVWFVVTILRIFLGIGKGITSGLRWLFAL